MDLTHEFWVPTPIEETWAHFQDVAGLAECFPGATVSEADGDRFRGSCKVKLGPIALVYQGSGTFVERDETAHRFVVEAKGKDKRGNGTATAHVTLTMAEGGGGTDVKVATDLAITGKPAQFGRGVMQDVSDKLLGQFVTCLEDRPVGGDSTGAPTEEAPATGASASAHSAHPTEPPEPVGPATDQPADSSAPPRDEALDLGAAVLPVLARTYGKQVLAAVAGLVALVLVRRLFRRH